MAARISFIIGFLFMILGIVFLLGYLEGTSRVSVLFSFCFVVAGSCGAALAIKLNKRSIYLFFAFLSLMVGLFLFLSGLGIIPRELVFRFWPLVSVFSGLALFPAGWRGYGGLSPRYIVPSCAFVILGCVLLVFTFDIVSFSFRHFILNWWPLVIALAGLVLIFISVGTKIGPGNEGR
jgi:hypothetical protein